MTQQSQLIQQFRTVYWRPEPKRIGAHGVTMAAPLGAAAIGDLCFTVIGLLSLYSGGNFAPLTRTLAAVGAFAVGIGASLGTLPTVIEIFRGSERPTGIDRACLWVNAGATVAGYTLGFGAALGNQAAWSAFVQEWGSLVFGLLVTADSITAAIVYARYQRGFDLRYRQWLEQFEIDAQRYAAWEHGLTTAPESGVEQQARLAPDEPALSLPTTATAAQKDSVEDTERKAVTGDIAERRSRVLALYDSDPARTQASVAELLGVSPSTVRNDLKALEGRGAVNRDNGTVKVMEVE